MLFYLMSLEKANYPSLNQAAPPARPYCYGLVRFIVLAACLFFAGLLQAQDLPQLSDQQALRYLNNNEQFQWEQALKRIAKGEDKVESGEWMKQKRSVEMGQGLGLDRSKQAQALIDEGNQLIAEGNKQKNYLVMVARKRAGEQQQKKQAAAVDVAAGGPEAVIAAAANRYDVEAESIGWESGQKGLAQAVLESIWAKGIRQVYVGGVYFIHPQGHSPAEDLSAAFSKALETANQDKGEIVAYQQFGLDVGVKRNKPVILIGGNKQAAHALSAVVFGEIYMNPGGNVLTLAIRAVDPTQLTILCSHLYQIEVGSGLIQYLPPSLLNKNQLSAADLNPKATLADNKDLIDRLVKQTDSFFYRFEFVGKEDAFRDRAGVLLLKHLLSRQTEFALVDFDFVISALAVEEKKIKQLPPPGNVLWLVHAIAADGLQPVSCLSLRNDVELEVGHLLF